LGWHDAAADGFTGGHPLCPRLPRLGAQDAFDEADAIYVEISLEVYRREAVRLMHGEALRATRDAAP
jgi:hypothetical protein